MDVEEPGLSDHGVIIAMADDEHAGFVQGLAARVSNWLFGAGDPDTAGYYVSGDMWPGGVRDSDLSIPKLYEVLDEAFNKYFDTALNSLAKVRVPDQSHGEVDMNGDG